MSDGLVRVSLPLVAVAPSASVESASVVLYTTDKMTTEKMENRLLPKPPANGNDVPPQPQASLAAKEVDGPKSLEPTRYGDWEHNGRCIDF
jgi:hypothetical protein